MKTSIYILIVFYGTLQVESWRPFTIRFDSIKCEKKSTLTSYLNCSITTKRPQGGLCFNVKFDTAIENPRLDLIILTSRQNLPDFVLVNLTKIDGCQFLKNKEDFNVLQILRKQFEKYSDLPGECPLTKGAEIHVKNLILDADSFPPYVPETKFDVQLQMWEDDTPMLDLNIIGNVEPKRSNKKVKV